MEVYELGPVGTNGYILWDETLKEAIVIDAPPGMALEVEKFLEEHPVRLKALLLTHGHWDHMGEAAKIQSMGAKVYGHKGDQVLFENPKVMSFGTPVGLKFQPVRVDQYLEDGETLSLLGQTVEVRHAPGHALGSLVYYFPQTEKAFCGDVIFAGSVGRTDLPGGSFEMLKNSILKKVYTLPEVTELHPGHGPMTLVSYEKKHNPYVKG